jgi:hypothetical protein
MDSSKISGFHRFFRDGVCQARGEFENYSDRSITFNWIEVPQCKEKLVRRTSQASDYLAGAL